MQKKRRIRKCRACLKGNVVSHDIKRYVVHAVFLAKTRQRIATIANVIEDSYLRELMATSLPEKYRVHYLLHYATAHDVVIAVPENASKRANTSGPIRGISLGLSNERGV
ncbi:unnamed protein product [Lasius platythorax]|uniref:Uncharacterized protein n=1 Tax=Lasius platythorax TaxID=488582 RepID=A0AAV2NWL0_9HYME